MTSAQKKNAADNLASTSSPMPPDQRQLMGPFDIIGDVHGCYRELHQLLTKLGYDVPQDPTKFSPTNITPPSGRRAVFVGDLVDRGENSITVIKMVMAMIEGGHGLCVVGNHDDKFRRWLKGNNVSAGHGLDGTILDFEREGSDLRGKLLEFLSSLPSYLWLAHGKLTVAHAGILTHMLGRTDARVRRFCLYGDTEGERDITGLPVRYHWAAGYRGDTEIVYGHTPVPKANWVNRTLCIDTGCCFGGALTALRWPEREIISVDAVVEYTARLRPFGHPPIRPQRVPC